MRRAGPAWGALERTPAPLPAAQCVLGAARGAPGPPYRLEAALLAAARETLPGLRCAAERADLGGLVRPRSYVLCAALSALALECYAALGGRARAAEVAEAAALLSLLTKIDDQVIDALDFHGGPLPARPRPELAARVWARLRPTLRAIETGRAGAGAEPRVALAADLGARLASLAADPRRLGRLRDLIAQGWRVQVHAVCALTDHPSRRAQAHIDAVTAQISGAWLLMIALVGALPYDAARWPAQQAQDAFWAWGLHIQRADALADLHKDLLDGHLCAAPLRHAFAQAPDALVEAYRAQDLQAIYGLLARTGADLAALPSLDHVARLRAQLAPLGRVGPLLHWIHGFLLWRYTHHPWCALSAARRAAFAPHLHSPRSWRAYVDAVDAWA